MKETYSSHFSREDGSGPVDGGSALDQHVFIPLKKGSFLLKHASTLRTKRKPKVHYFQLSQDCLELTWTRVSGTTKSVQLHLVRDILLGQGASQALRKVPLKSEASCLSLVYITREDELNTSMSQPASRHQPAMTSLDLTFFSKTQRDFWYQGLLQAVRYAQMAHMNLMNHGKSVEEEYSVEPMGDMFMWGNIVSGHVRQQSSGMYEGLDAMLHDRIDTGRRPRCLPESSVPRLVPSNNLVNIQKARVGDMHAVIQAEDGALYSFGENAKGQLGLGHDEDVFIMRKIEYGFENIDDKHHIVEVALGKSCSIALTQDGRIFVWGKQFGSASMNAMIPSVWNSSLSTLYRTQIMHVSCGPFHCGAISNEGKLYTWGEGLGGKLGHGDMQSRSTPTLVSSLQGFVKKVACGSWHTAAIVALPDESALAWHTEDDTVSSHERTPERRTLHRRTFSHFANSFGTVLQPDAHIDCHREGEGGFLFTWGGINNTNLFGDSSPLHGVKGQKKKTSTPETNKGCLGHGDETLVSGSAQPKIVRGALAGGSVRDVAAGYNFTVALSNSGIVYQMGSQLGSSRPGSPASQSPWEGCTTPVAVRGSLSHVFVDQVHAGLHHALVIARNIDKRTAKPKGTPIIFTWGRGKEGQLGHGKLEDSVLPIPLEQFKSRCIYDVSCGSHSCVVVCQHDGKKIVSDFGRDAWNAAVEYFNGLLLTNPSSFISRDSETQQSTSEIHGSIFEKDSSSSISYRPSRSVISVSETGVSGEYQKTPEGSLAIRRSFGRFASQHSFSESESFISGDLKSVSNDSNMLPSRWRRNSSSLHVQQAIEDTASSSIVCDQNINTIESEKAALLREKELLSKWAKELDEKEKRLSTLLHTNSLDSQEGTSPIIPDDDSCWTEDVDDGVSATFTMQEGKAKLVRLRFSREKWDSKSAASWYSRRNISFDEDDLRPLIAKSLSKSSSFDDLHSACSDLEEESSSEDHLNDAINKLTIEQ
jgi:alpha-tubulin suppressor-like RCC1 family protein